MRWRFAAALVIAALATAGCGGDDDEPAGSGGTGAQGASGTTSNDITAEEFLLKLLPEKQTAIEAVVATAPECEGVKVEPSFVLVVSDAASKADPRAPITDVVVEEC